MQQTSQSFSARHTVNLGWFAYYKVRVVGSNVLYCISENAQPCFWQQCSVLRLRECPGVLAYFAGSRSGLPEGKDPQLDSEVAKKKDPFFKEVDKRT